MDHEFWRTVLIDEPWWSLTILVMATVSYLLVCHAVAPPRRRPRGVGRHYAVAVYARGDQPVFTRQVLQRTTQLTLRQQLFMVSVL